MKLSSISKCFLLVLANTLGSMSCARVESSPESDPEATDDKAPIASIGAASTLPSQPVSAPSTPEGAESGIRKRLVTYVVSNSSTADAYSGLRPDADPMASLPSLLANFDPRSVNLTGSYATLRNGRIPSELSGRILAIDDGRSIGLTKCSLAFPPPSGSKLAPTVDGLVGEWRPNDIVAVDRSGDGIDGLAEFDGAALLLRETSSDWYIGVEVGGTWPTSASVDQRLVIAFSNWALPQSEVESPRLTGVLQALEVFGPELWAKDANGTYHQVSKGVGPGLIDYDLATAGNVIELRIAKSSLSIIANAPVLVEARIADSSGAVDYLGGHLSGTVTDYACIVPSVDETGAVLGKRMLVLRRDPEVSAERAEIFYRAVINAIPAVERATGERPSRSDTIPVTVLRRMMNAGLNHSKLGLFLNADATRTDSAEFLPVDAFAVAAHEYAHSLNVVEYRFPDIGLAEGHSEWAAGRALEEFFGPGPAVLRRLTATQNVVTAEAALGVGSIGEASFGSAPHSPEYYYNKADLWFSKLVDAVGSKKLHEVVYPGAAEGTLASFLASSGGSGLGWFSGAYATSGSFAAPESTDGSEDADGDGLSDAIEDAYAGALNARSADAIQFLAWDGRLDDWRSYLPAELSPWTTNTCADVEVVEGGVASDGDWLLAAIQTGSSGLPANTRVVLSIHFVDEALGPIEQERQVQIDVGSRQAYLVGGNMPRTIPMPFVASGRQVEIGTNLAWLGWIQEPKSLTAEILVLRGEAICAKWGPKTL